jgi:hypothetical protein
MISVLSGILNSAEESEDINNSNGGVPCHHHLMSHLINWNPFKRARIALGLMPISYTTLHIFELLAEAEL